MFFGFYTERGNSEHGMAIQIQCHITYPMFLFNFVHLSLEVKRAVELQKPLSASSYRAVGGHR